jgi:hypothetical protein
MFDCSSCTSKPGDGSIECACQCHSPLSAPAQKLDAGKPRWGLLPFKPLAFVVRVLTKGAAKYRPHGWRSVENGVERYRDALLRHVAAHMDGEWLDPDSGEPHLAHVAANALFLLELERSDV